MATSVGGSGGAPAARVHIERMRRERYYIGRDERNPLEEDIQQAVNYLSEELYSKDAHFLMELIQNAEDNKYPLGVVPSLEFVITSEDITATGAESTLLVFNNEKGFSPANIDSICRIGKSTKKGSRHRGYIGEKGIGFKSVFVISAQPCIFSNGYQIRFNEEPCPVCNIGYIVPEWVEENPSRSDLQAIYGSSTSLPATAIILPLKGEKVHKKTVESQLKMHYSKKRGQSDEFRTYDTRQRTKTRQSDEFRTYATRQRTKTPRRLSIEGGLSGDQRSIMIDSEGKLRSSGRITLVKGKRPKAGINK